MTQVGVKIMSDNIVVNVLKGGGVFVGSGCSKNFNKSHRCGDIFIEWRPSDVF